MPFKTAAWLSFRLSCQSRGQGYNHFEMFETLGNLYGPLGRAMLEQMGLVHCRVGESWDWQENNPKNGDLIIAYSGIPAVNMFVHERIQ